MAEASIVKKVIIPDYVADMCSLAGKLGAQVARERRLGEILNLTPEERRDYKARALQLEQQRREVLGRIPHEFYEAATSLYNI